MTVSDPREDISVESLLNIAEKYPLVEFGIQAHPYAMSRGQARNIWFDKIVKTFQNMPKQPNLALHINYDWCNYICTGIIPHELDWWLRVPNAYTDLPVIHRIQLNIGDFAYDFDAKKLAYLIAAHPNQEFILPFNNGTKYKAEKLKQTGAKFSLLFDDSYGAGITPNKWNAPVYEDIPHGYAGGLGPDNIAQNLDKINSVLPENYETWIDAEEKLRDRKTTRVFTINLAEKYLQNALGWYNQHTK